MSVRALKASEGFLKLAPLQQNPALRNEGRGFDPVNFFFRSRSDGLQCADALAPRVKGPGSLGTVRRPLRIGKSNRRYPPDGANQDGGDRWRHSAHGSVLISDVRFQIVDGRLQGSGVRSQWTRLCSETPLYRRSYRRQAVEDVVYRERSAPAAHALASVATVSKRRLARFRG